MKNCIDTETGKIIGCGWCMYYDTCFEFSETKSFEQKKALLERSVRVSRERLETATTRLSVFLGRRHLSGERKK
jgi:hypothetical protein